MTIDWTKFVEVIQQHQRFLLVSHIRPDCDALGSELGMAGVLEALGKDVRIVNGDSTPPNLAFIDPRGRIEVLGNGVTLADLQEIELLMVLDTSAWAQLGPMGDALRSLPAHKIVLDHHVGEDDLGAELFKDPEAEATGRLVVDAAGHLDVALTEEIGMPLFAALATDTGWFRFNSVTEKTYACAAQLLEAGVNPTEIYRQLYECDTLGRVKLRGRALERIVVEEAGKLAHTHLRKEDFSETGALLSDTEDVVNNLFLVKGVEVAVILLEQPEGGVKISFRSRGMVDCSELAGLFGGGGHQAAAGAFLKDSLEQASVSVLDAVRKQMQ
ncbi:MAG: DHH family phosphoesterase [Pirellulaceae bacterium]